MHHYVFNCTYLLRSVDSLTIGTRNGRYHVHRRDRISSKVTWPCAKCQSCAWHTEAKESVGDLHGFVWRVLWESRNPSLWDEVTSAAGCILVNDDGNNPKWLNSRIAELGSDFCILWTEPLFPLVHPIKGCQWIVIVRRRYETSTKCFPLGGMQDSTSPSYCWQSYYQIITITTGNKISHELAFTLWIWLPKLWGCYYFEIGGYICSSKPCTYSISLTPLTSSRILCLT